MEDKRHLVDLLKNMTCDGDIMLEPRLQEYLKKKHFYKTTKNIEPCISPEKEYLITNQDKKILRAFLNGQRDVYDKDNKLNPFAKVCKQKKQYFPSRELMNDPRIPQIEKEQRNLCGIPINRGMFVPEDNSRYYEDPIQPLERILDSRDFSNDGKGWDTSHMRFQPRLDPLMDPIGIETHDKHESQFRIDPDPRNKYIISDLLKQEKSKQCTPHGKFNSNKVFKNYNLIDHDNIGIQKRYGEELESTFSQMADMDTDHKVVIPSVASRSKKDINTSAYRMETFNDLERRDLDVESQMILGMPSYRLHNRSYGYRNPEDHYFDFIDQEFAFEPIEDWDRGGAATRNDNKGLAKNRIYKRVVM